MAIVKRLGDYSLRGGSGGYHVEGFPGLSVGQVNKMQSVRGSVTHGLEGKPGTGYMESFDKLRKEMAKRVMDAETKEINTKMQLSAMEAKSFNDNLKMKTDALAALRKEAPKDKLGNTIQTPEMDALQQDIIGMLRGKVGPQGAPLDPMQAGMTQAQIDAFAAERNAGQQQQAPPPPQQAPQGMRPFAVIGEGPVNHIKGGRGDKTGNYRMKDGEVELEVIVKGQRKWAKQSELIDVGPEDTSQPFDIKEYFRRKQQEADIAEGRSVDPIAAGWIG